MRIALGLSYDGAPFHGWQSQPSGNTVQDRLEQALAHIAGAPVRVTAAGRTDTGVHALAQVVHFDTPVERPENAWVRGTNTFLPDAIAVQWARGVNAEFHARFAATGRRYSYLLYNHAVRPALMAGKAGWYHAPLDVEAMREGASLLLGQHDFSTFRAAECQAKSPVRTLRELTILRSGSYLMFDIAADAFLHHMVRNIVGALVYVGSGRHKPQWIAEILAARERSRAAPTFAPDGLYLADIAYESRWSLPGFPRIMPFHFPGRVEASP
jgi:tRNA pseudouridine38-40 synthase